MKAYFADFLKRICRLSALAVCLAAVFSGAVATNMSAVRAQTETAPPGAETSQPTELPNFSDTHETEDPGVEERLDEEGDGGLSSEQLIFIISLVIALYCIFYFVKKFILVG